MITNQPIDLGRVSEETKQSGFGTTDSALVPLTDPHT
jgi:hypothetical protein